jgi:hypothetical protein
MSMRGSRYDLVCGHRAANEIIEGEYEDEEEYEEELARPARESPEATQTLAPAASADPTHAEDTSTTGQLSPEKSQAETTPPSSGDGNPD